MAVTDSNATNFWFSFLVGLAIILSLSGGLSLWETTGIPLLPGGPFAAVAIAIAILALGFRTKTSLGALSFCSSGFALTLLVLLASDWTCRSYSLFPGPLIRGEIAVLAVVAWFLIRTDRSWLLKVIGLVSSLLLILCLINETKGHLIFSDDHPTFFFRLNLLKENFPNIPFFYPIWNGGIDQRDFFATGSLNVFFLFWPIIKFTNLLNSYNLIIALVLFGLTPLSIFIATRLLSPARLVPYLSALLSLSANLFMYRWALKYGTMGFVTTAALVPLNLILATKLIIDGQLSWSERLLFVATFTLMLFWSPAGLIFIPTGIVAVWHFRITFVNKQLWGLVLVLVLLNLPWLTIFWSVSNVSGFVSLSPEHYQISTHQEQNSDDHDVSTSLVSKSSNRFNLDKSIGIVRDTAIATNPLILLFFLPGFFLLPKRYRLALALASVWLFVVGSLIAPLKPQLELGRMLLILSLFGCIPVGYALNSLVELAQRSDYLRQDRLFASVTLGLLLCGPWVAASIVKNRSIERYYLSGPDVAGLSELITKHSGQGRVLFSGFVLHDLDHGHLAPLTLFSGKELIASSYVHNLWRYRQIFPESFMARDWAGIDDYLNLYNVTAVVAHERDWRLKFLSRPDSFKLVGQVGRFSFFERLDLKPSFFVSGAGTIQTTDHSLVVNLQTPNAVIKYNYFPFLEASSCKLSSYQASPEVVLIRLDDCPLGQPIVIKSISAWKRVSAGVLSQ